MVSLPDSESYMIYLHPVLGTEYIDTVTIAPGATIPQQSIGVVSSPTFFVSPFDGILGCVDPLPYLFAFVSTPFPVVLVPET
jgi:hypothetical protein